MLSNEELMARLGKLTASRMGDAMDYKKDGEPGAERNKYMMELVCVRMTDILIPHFVTPAMLHGIENEPLVKIAYMAHTGADLQDGHFVDHPKIDLFGATPDSLHPEGGLVEFKCPTTMKFMEWLIAGVVPEEHKPQMVAQLLCTDRQWCDFVAFDPRMPERKRLFIRRFEPTHEERVNVEGHAVQFLKEVDELFHRVVESEAA